MQEHTITVDIYAGSGETRYRIYVDNDLLVERDFIWPSHEIFLRENIIVNLAEGAHRLNVELVGTQGTIKPRNVTVDGKPSLFDFVIEE
jgi:hypothetical protein